MSRERTTWNRETIKQAATQRVADPYTMNQDHSQPPADKYLTGDPSSFAEDIHPNNWDVEYGADGQTKRDEIGMPEKRPETYNHPEKTASESEEFLLKKADLTVKVSRMMLAGQKFASDESRTSAIEDQAVALMKLADQELIETHNRLAAQQGDQDEDDDDDDQQKQAGDDQQQDDDDDEGDQQKQAGDLAQQVTAMVQEKLSGLIREAMGAFGQGQQMQQDVAQQQQMQQDVAQQQMQQDVAQQQMQDPMAQQQMDEEAMLDQMLAPEDQLPMQEGDIEMGMSEMDTGEIVLGADDAELRALFAQDQDDDDEQQQSGQQQQKQAGVRTASTQTVGTKPKGGVSRIGGNGAPGASDNKLDNLWASAPDVREAFGLPRN